jgi:hypothetical protein
MRKILSSLFSLVTVVGGHLFNRRLDLGLLFFALLLLAIVISWVVLPMLLWSGGEGNVFPDNFSLTWMGYSLLLAIGTVLLTSAIVSFLKASDHSSRRPLGKIGMLGGSLAALLSTAAVLWIGSMGINYIMFANISEGSISSESKSGKKKHRSRFSRSSYFYKTVRYGGKWVSSSQLEDLPKGEFYISGRISYLDTPAKDVSLFAVFNNRYRSEEITTNKDGVFSIPVPKGEWLLNRIKLEKWPDQPDGISLSVFGGVDQPLSENRYDSGPSFRAEGLTLQAAEAPIPMKELQLVIRPNIQLLWPKSQGQIANLDKDKVTWQGISDAKKYQLQLHRMERDGSSTSYFPTAWINTDNTEIPLDDFPTVSDDPDKKSEYLVRVYAFDKDGKLLTSSGEFVSSQTLVLKGNSITDTSDFKAIEKIPGLSMDEQLKEMEMRHRDRQRLKAADTLTEEGLIDAAKIVAERVESKSLEGEKLRTMGLILAAEGNCKEAEIKLQAANKKRGENCFPKLYRERCGKK